MNDNGNGTGCGNAPGETQTGTGSVSGQGPNPAPAQGYGAGGQSQGMGAGYAQHAQEIGSGPSAFGSPVQGQSFGGVPPGAQVHGIGQPGQPAQWGQAPLQPAPGAMPGPAQAQAYQAHPGQGVVYGMPNQGAMGQGQPQWANGAHAYPHQAAPGYGHAPQNMGYAAHPGMGAGMGAGAQGGGMSQLMQEISGGGNGLSSLSQMLNLNDKELWKGALIGAAAVLLLTNDSVQNALFKTGVRAKNSVKAGVDTVKARAATVSAEVAKETGKTTNGDGEDHV